AVPPRGFAAGRHRAGSGRAHAGGLPRPRLYGARRRGRHRLAGPAPSRGAHGRGRSRRPARRRLAGRVDSLGRGAAALTPKALFLLIPLAMGLLAWWKQVYPERGLVFLALLPAALSLVLIVARNALPWLIAFDALVVLVMLVDLATVPPKRWFT